MAHNGGKGSSPSNNACGSKLCRCFVFVLAVLVCFLLYTCMKVMSRNEILVDRVRSYGQQMARVKFEQNNQARSLEQEKSQGSLLRNSLNQASAEVTSYRSKTNDCQKVLDEQKRKLEAMGTELNSKEQIYMKLDQSCKQLSNDLETRTSKLQDSEKRAGDYINQLKSLQQSSNGNSKECQNRVQSEVGRVVNIIRKLYGADPVKALVKAGVDITGALNVEGSSESQGEVRDRNAKQGDGQPNPEQPQEGEEQPKVGQEQPKSGQEQPKSGEEQTKPSTEKPKLGQDQSNLTTEQKSGQEQQKAGEEIRRSEQNVSKLGQEQPKLGQVTPKPDQEQLKASQEPPKPESPKPGQEQPKQGQEQPKPGQEQPKQGQEQPNQGQEQPKPGQEQPKFEDERLKNGENVSKSMEKKNGTGKAKADDDEYYEDENETDKKPQEGKPGQGRPGQEPGHPKGQGQPGQGLGQPRGQGQPGQGQPGQEPDQPRGQGQPGQGQPGQEPGQPRGQGQPGQGSGQPRGQGQPGQAPGQGQPGQLKFEKSRGQDKGDNAIKPGVVSKDEYEGEE